MSIASPQDVLDYWIGETSHTPEALKDKNKLWFTKSDATDADIRHRFASTLAALADGAADDWAARGPKEHLAAIITLDQFSRNLNRGSAKAFDNDPLALRLANQAVSTGINKTFSEVEQIFCYLPFEHSEDKADQQTMIDLLNTLLENARAPYKPYVNSTRNYAYDHKRVIDEFGRFPHRNAALGRINTPEEAAYLAQPGSGF